MLFKHIKNNTEDILLLKNFLDRAGTSLLTFRYFTKRPFTVIETHLLTVILLEEGQPMAYGHLDPENKIVWLGICVIEKGLGKGYGIAMMNYLIDYAAKHNIQSISLKVDINNKRAISRYQKSGFEIIQDENISSITMRRDMKQIF